MTRKKTAALIGGVAVIGMILTACAPPTPETVTVIQTQIVEQPVKETQVVVEQITGTPQPSFSTPNPILGDLRIRQGIAYCTNRDEIISAIYSYVEDKSILRMDSFIPTSHWAHAGGLTQYPFDPEKGKALFEAAGWKMEEGNDFRTNANGDELALKYTATVAQFRQILGGVFESNMADCGLRVLRFHVPAAWWFGSTSGLSRRDFELGEFAWIGQADPGGRTLYACDQVPRPENGWNGQNDMGWCNETASKAIIAANNTLNREERIKQYAIVQQEFVKDVPSLPLYNRLQAEAATANLINFKTDPTDYYTRNAHEWELQDGGTTLVLGLSQEPATMFTLVEASGVQVTVDYLIHEPFFLSESYDYQPNLVKSLPTIESGGATNDTVEVKEGDIVYSTSGEPVELKAGVELTDADGNTITYQSGALKMKQLTVTFETVDGLTWSDGEPLKQADWELGYAVDCDHDTGGVSYTTCDAIAKDGVKFNGDTSFTVKYVPGYQYPIYFANMPFTTYPSHRVLADGRKLADVPHKDWSTLPEIAETPLGWGPYVMKEWVKAQSMTLEANPYYFRGPDSPKIKKIVVQFVADTQTAVAQFLQGQLDVLGSETLGGGPEVGTLLQALKDGKKIQVHPFASPTWEHLDMNLFVK